MPYKKSLALTLVLGFAAILLGWFLVSQGRRGDEIPGMSYRPEYVSAGPMLHLTKVLSSDALEGRAAGTPGGEAARGFVRKRLEDIGVAPFLAGGWEQPVVVLPREGLADPLPGANLVGWIPGETPGEGPVLILTAHYDHLGIRDGETYNGADDNASGIAMLTAVAEHFVANPPRHDMLIVALDAEEVGLQGARAFVGDAAIPMARVALNINLDMVSRSEKGELYAAGTYHTPALAALVDEVASAAPVRLLKGHDRPEDGIGDWTLQSDHALFHRAGIPFLYFGVEDHPGYHQPSDDFAAITPEFFVRASDTVVAAVRAADADLADIYTMRRPVAAKKAAEGTSE